MSNEKYAISPAWQKKIANSEPFDYTLSSNPDQTCLLKKIEMSDIMQFGLVDDLDFLAKEIADISSKDNGETQRETRRKNSKNMERIVNLVVQSGVIMPELHLPPENNQDRVDGLIYVDSIPFMDRVELFSVIYDTEGLPEFREEQSSNVGNVDTVTEVSLPASEPVVFPPAEPQSILSEQSSS